MSLGNTFEEDEVNVTAELEDVSILSTIPDPQPDLAVNLKEIMNMETVPVPNTVDSKEVQNPKTVWFRQEDADVTFLVDITFFKNQSQPGQVMDYMSFLESLKNNACFRLSMKFCKLPAPALLLICLVKLVRLAVGWWWLLGGHPLPCFPGGISHLL